MELPNYIGFESSDLRIMTAYSAAKKELYIHMFYDHFTVAEAYSYFLAQIAKEYEGLPTIDKVTVYGWNNHTYSALSFIEQLWPAYVVEKSPDHKLEPPSSLPPLIATTTHYCRVPEAAGSD